MDCNQIDYKPYDITNSAGPWCNACKAKFSPDFIDWAQPFFKCKCGANILIKTDGENHTILFQVVPTIKDIEYMLMFPEKYTEEDEEYAFDIYREFASLSS